MLTVTACAPAFGSLTSGSGPHGALVASVKMHFEHAPAAPPVRPVLRSSSVFTEPALMAATIELMSFSLHAPMIGLAGSSQGSDAASIGVVGGHPVPPPSVSSPPPSSV